MLITGESGVGKDHLVRRIHAEGIRKGRPLVLVNCAAIPHELISSELFGYAPGSFTGARTGGKTGKFVEAHTGVLFLDEIGDMALDLQTALLCALDSSEIVPVGGSKPVAVDVQVIAATNSDLRELRQKGHISARPLLSPEWRAILVAAPARASRQARSHRAFVGTGNEGAKRRGAQSA